MATAEQLKSLIRSHFGNDTQRFYTIALQVAAHEAKMGHASVAHDIRNLVDMEKKKSGPKIINFPKDLKGLVLTEKSKTSKETLVIGKDLKERIDQLIHEYYQQDKLKSFGLSHRRKILLIGPPGTGKTMTAKVIAHELNINLHTIQVDRLVTKFMGETSAKLRQIFDLMAEEHGVYLFDEFDAIGGERTRDNDVGEMRRVLNAFLQFIEQDTSDSIVIAATNNPGLLDHALFRRFDDVLYYKNPTEDERYQLILNLLGTFKPSKLNIEKVKKSSNNLCHADIVAACNDTVKKAILSDKKKITQLDLHEMLKNRRNMHLNK